MWSNQEADSFTFPPGATTGQRMTIDSNGILIYAANGDLVFAATPGGAVPAHTGNPIIVGGIFGGSPGLAFDTPIGGLVQGLITTNDEIYWLMANGANAIDFLWGTKTTAGVYGNSQDWVPNVLDRPRFEFGSGYLGSYYLEQSSFTIGTSMPNGIATDIPMDASGVIRNDYNLGVSQIDPSGDFWVCPDTGMYEIAGNACLTNVAANAGGSNFRIGHATGGGSPIYLDERSIATGGGIATSFYFKGLLQAGDKIYFSLQVFCGVGNTMSANNRSVTFQRVL